MAYINMFWDTLKLRILFVEGANPSRDRVLAGRRIGIGRSEFGAIGRLSAQTLELQAPDHALR